MSNPRPKSPSQSPVDNANKFVDEALNEGGSPLAKLFASRARPVHYATFPGADEGDENARIALRALVDHEYVTARIDAINFITKSLKLDEWLLATDDGRAMLDNEIQVQVLFRAMRNAKNHDAPWAATPAEVRLYLEPSERLYLWNELATFTAQRSPIRALQSDAEVEEVVSALGKGLLPHAALSYYDSPSLRNIIISLADRLATLMKQPSSDT